MPELSTETAIERAREALSLSGVIPGRAVYVARLDRPGTGYYLVWFGAEDATVGVAAVDASCGEVLSRASLTGTGRHLAITAEEASRRADATGTGSARLVWRPCRVSFSMLFPFWEIATLRGSVFIDQQGHSWTTLEVGGPGG